MDLVVDAGNRLFVASANNARLEGFGLDEFEDAESVAPGVLRVEPAVLTTPLEREYAGLRSDLRKAEEALRAELEAVF